jgi:hypothetical protein
MHASKKPCAGIDKVIDGGMTVAGRSIRDARAFDITPETKTCEGWSTQRLEGLWNQVHARWEKHGHSVSQLPDNTRERYTRIQREAFDRARASGWNASLDNDD